MAYPEIMEIGELKVPLVCQETKAFRGRQVKQEIGVPQVYRDKLDSPDHSGVQVPRAILVPQVSRVLLDELGALDPLDNSVILVIRDHRVQPEDQDRSVRWEPVVQQVSQDRRDPVVRSVLQDLLDLLDLSALLEPRVTQV